MAKNIEININTNGTYEILYPKVNLTNNNGTTLPLSSTSGNLAYSRISNVPSFSRIQSLYYIGTSTTSSGESYGTISFSVPSNTKIIIINYERGVVSDSNSYSYYISPIIYIADTSISSSYKGRTNSFIMVKSGSSSTSDGTMLSYIWSITYSGGTTFKMTCMGMPNMAPINNTLYNNFKNYAYNVMNWNNREYVVTCFY